jgi:hypothetical protein
MFILDIAFVTLILNGLSRMNNVINMYINLLGIIELFFMV